MQILQPVRSPLFLAAFLLGAVAFVDTARAQSTWIVDAAGGPAADFTDLTAAVNAVAPGDILIVEPGRYVGLDTSKGVHIFGRGLGFQLDNAGPFAPGLTVRNLPAGQSFTLSNAQVVPARTGVRLSGCLGSVLLEEVVMVEPSGSQGVASVDSCSYVQFSGCRHRLVISNSNVSMDQCEARGAGATFTRVPAVTANNSTLAIAASFVAGGVNPLVGTAPTPAIELTNTTLDLTGFDRISHAVVVGHPSLTGPTSAIVGTGSVRFDPHVIVLGHAGAPPIDPMLNLTTTLVPVLLASPAVLGGQQQIQIRGTFGEMFLLALGLPQAPAPVAGLGGALWLTAPILTDVGIIPFFQVAWRLGPVPNTPAILGLQFSRQAVTTAILWNEGMRFSNPITFTVRPF